MINKSEENREINFGAASVQGEMLFPKTEDEDSQIIKVWFFLLFLNEFIVTGDVNKDTEWSFDQSKSDWIKTYTTTNKTFTISENLESNGYEGSDIVFQIEAKRNGEIMFFNDFYQNENGDIFVVGLETVIFTYQENLMQWVFWYA
jgi:hypothetical protein